MDIHSVRQLLRMKSIYDIPLRVTYYARVSSESDEQLNSLGNQIRYYEDFIKKNPAWVKTYAAILYYWCLEYINMKEKTMRDLFTILTSIPVPANLNGNINTAIFRYNKKYKSIFPSDSEITIENAIEEYEKYLEWKKVNK